LAKTAEVLKMLSIFEEFEEYLSSLAYEMIGYLL
jgi:hypothetical protein